MVFTVLATTCFTPIGAEANSWPTTYFEIVSGRPVAPASADVDDAIEPLSTEERKHSWLPPAQRAEIEAYLHKVAERLRRWQFPDPLLPVHEPTLPRSDGATSVYRIYLNPLPAGDEAGEYSGVCDNDVWLADSLAQKQQLVEKLRGAQHISLDTTDWAYVSDANDEGAPRLQWQHLNLTMLVAGHELFHAVQAGSPAYLYECDVPGWIEEGTADAVAYDMFREFKGFKPIAGNFDTPAELHGLRHYDKPLETTSKEERYLTQSFWRYVAERNASMRRNEPLPGPNWEPFDYSYLDVLFDDTSIPIVDGNNDSEDPPLSLEFVEWVDDVLQEQTAVTVGLERLLPDFFSVMAGFPGKRAKDVKQEKWLRELCSHAQERDLLLEDQFRLADFEASIDARGCLSFSVDRDQKLSANPISITITAAPDSKETASELSLGEAGGQRVMHGSLSAGCTSDEASCEVSWTWLLDSPGPKYFVLTAAHPEEIEETKGIKNLGIAVSTGGIDADLSDPDAPTQSKNSRSGDTDPGPGGSFETARERMQEGSGRLTNDGAMTTSARRVNFDDGSGEIIIEMGTTSGIADVLVSTLGAGGITQHALATAQLMGENIGEIIAAGQLVEEDRMSRDGASISIRIPLVDYGFEGQIDNAAIRVSRAGGDELYAMGPRDIDRSVAETRFPASGNVTIKQYSPTLMVGTFTGSLVEAYSRERAQRDRQRGVRQPTLDVVKTISGQFWISAPWQYDDRYESIFDDTVLLRLDDDLVDLMRGMMLGDRPVSESPSSPNGNTAPGGPFSIPGDGGGNISCKCTCEEFEQMEALGEQLENMGEQDNDTVVALSKMMTSTGMCFSVCMAQYEACY